VSFGATSNLHVAKPVLSKATGRGIVLRQRSYSRFLAEGNTQHEGFSTDTFAPAATVTLSIEITCVRHRFEPRYGGPYAGCGSTHRPMFWTCRGQGPHTDGSVPCGHPGCCSASDIRFAAWTLVSCRLRNFRSNTGFVYAEPCDECIGNKILRWAGHFRRLN
jgi:hypothetical protein